MEYFLIKKSNFQEFKLEIKSKLDDGWILHGKEFEYKVLENTTVFTQAVIKHTLNDDPPSVEQILASWNVG